MYNTCSRGRRYYFGGVCCVVYCLRPVLAARRKRKKTNFNPMFTGPIFIALNNRLWRPLETAVIVILSILVLTSILVIQRLKGRYYIYPPILIIIMWWWRWWWWCDYDDGTATIIIWPVLSRDIRSDMTMSL